ncbi:hypothetical protein CRUP_005310 [Coryphaenoides rupestris]|nr:hypothetical protein CRUP_005310 [Coryphaenoides rupestris]
MRKIVTLHNNRGASTRVIPRVLQKKRLTDQREMDDNDGSINDELEEAGEILNRSSEPPAQSKSEIHLKAMKKHDSEQAEVMVMEERVKMLVVQTGEDVYRCDKCLYVSRKGSALKHHCQFVCQKRSKGHDCPACGAHFKQSRGLDTHLMKKCPARQRTTRAFKVVLRNHSKRVHQLEDSLSCPECDFTCGSDAALKSHQLRTHSLLECSTCQQRFDTKKSLETHQRSHLGHRCQVCSFASRTRQLLAQHLLEEHEEEEEDGSRADKPLKCSHCEFSCCHQLVLEQHLRSHGGTRLYKCTDCKYTTWNKQKITWHIRIHTGEKPYGCEQCSDTCSNPFRLKIHMRVHQPEKKYLCTECGYKCKWQTQLKYHMTKHTGTN